MSVVRSNLVTVTALAVLALTACQSAEQPGAEPEAAPSPPVVDIVVSDFAFDAPAELASGWTTFRLENIGQQEHFALFQRLPEGKRVADYGSEVGAVFGAVWERYDSGELDREGAGKALGEELPEWFFTEIVQSGGVALIEPGGITQATIHLEPGIYALECYVKTPEGVWHTMLGMVTEVTVTEQSTGAAPPAADIELTLSNYEIAVSGELVAGSNTVAVHVVDTPEGMMKHDINLFRLDEETTLDEIVVWMDWMDLAGFRAPAPGHSLGGVEHMTAGSTGYMTVDFEPGRYAWVSEEYAARGMAVEFTIE